ncbi:hypothetical protein A2866_03150 [Candidatus Roizmanbacteria bacterium RIFCSPHIGHO2_01_FULL_39_8]|uniref:Uncharacterized protein n=3 Tax=Candidatus Roizmaniibacteriota TaxID=1752723 RepID=A0A1F7GGP6_9BACT|nr:MAG: hypothetical protein A2866_03150 [Candidatus Roizmanbacteria bacterium RIFCSPHIGHO2_01_FULL_39_8]OGK25330.1 MAG: hypothetical protein A3C28_00935 [Candidatus Roizmanbacteria bacterium RIFCSPHIGHO2_02_FULL_39_9]OGK37612.1 MAG: hypothetical protein A3F60_01795 [Candidatus Roizmanbacteria bacterium RIFCSPHIGHO2_12_FULL_39_8]
MKKFSLIFFLLMLFFFVPHIIRAAPVPPANDICRKEISPGLIIERKNGEQACNGLFDFMECKDGVFNHIDCKKEYGDGYICVHSNAAQTSAGCAYILPTSASGGASGFSLFPQSGISCGKGIDPKKETYDPNNPAQSINACCYSSVENMAEINKDIFKDIPIAGSIFSGLAGAINGRINAFPWVVLPEEITKNLPSVGSFRTGLKDYYSNNRCEAGSGISPNGIPPGQQGCYCQVQGSPSLASLAVFCNNIPGPNCAANPDDPAEKCRCYKCVGFDPRTKTAAGAGGIWTSLGCIESTLSSFISKTVMSLGVSLAGIFALLCIIYSAFQLQTSQGNPEKIKKAQELLTSCIMGLMLIIFSIFILRLIGVDILKIPGFY